MCLVTNTWFVRLWSVTFVETTLKYDVDSVFASNFSMRMVTVYLSEACHGKLQYILSFTTINNSSSIVGYTATWDVEPPKLQDLHWNWRQGKEEVIQAQSLSFITHCFWNFSGFKLATTATWVDHSGALYLLHQSQPSPLYILLLSDMPSQYRPIIIDSKTRLPIDRSLRSWPTLNAMLPFTVHLSSFTFAAVTGSCNLCGCIKCTPRSDSELSLCEELRIPFSPTRLVIPLFPQPPFTPSTRHCCVCFKSRDLLVAISVNLLNVPRSDLKNLCEHPLLSPTLWWKMNPFGAVAMRRTST